MNKFDILVEKTLISEKSKKGDSKAAFIKDTFKSGSKFGKIVFDWHGVKEDDIWDAVENQEFVTVNDIVDFNKKWNYFQVLLFDNYPKDDVYKFAKHMEDTLGVVTNNVGML